MASSVNTTVVVPKLENGQLIAYVSDARKSAFAEYDKLDAQAQRINVLATQKIELKRNIRTQKGLMCLRAAVLYLVCCRALSQAQDKYERMVDHLLKKSIEQIKRSIEGDIGRDTVICIDGIEYRMKKNGMDSFELFVGDKCVKKLGAGNKNLEKAKKALTWIILNALFEKLHGSELLLALQFANQNLSLLSNGYITEQVANNNIYPSQPQEHKRRIEIVTQGEVLMKASDVFTSTKLEIDSNLGQGPTFKADLTLNLSNRTVTILPTAILARKISST